MKKRLKKKYAKKYMDTVKEEILLCILLRKEPAKIGALKLYHNLLEENYDAKQYYYKGDK